MLTKEKFKDQKHIQVIKRHLRNNGFCCDAYKPSYLQRRILVRLRSHQLDSYSKYCRILKKDPEEYKKLLDALTINVTKFFRDAEVYQIVQSQLIPDFLKTKKPRNPIRIWSAGCASGEEPYSIAILILEAMGSKYNNYRFSIIATDIDEKSLRVARKGVYSPEKLEELPSQIVNKYFVHNQEYHVKQDLKSHVVFKKSDLLADNGIKFCDVIFCRNVLIYFNREDQDKIMRLFHKNLQANGILVLGKTEVLPPGFASMFLCVNRRAHIYRKKSLEEIGQNPKMSEVF